MPNNNDLKFKYSVNMETQRVLYTYSKLDWLQKEGYKISWPKNIDFLDNKNLSEDYIRNIINEEYRTREYKEVSLELEELWKSKSKNIIKNILKTKLPLEKEYIVYLTKYGVGGSYKLPNKIVLNFNNTNSLFKTVVHEIIHLCVEPLIKKYKIEHWQKERIVDLIVLKINPRWKKTQQIPLNTKKLDKIFFDNYPDIDKILKLYIFKS